MLSRYLLFDRHTAVANMCMLGAVLEESVCALYRRSFCGTRVLDLSSTLEAEERNAPSAKTIGQELTKAVGALHCRYFSV